MAEAQEKLGRRDSVDAVIASLRGEIERLEKERDELRTYAHEATKAITGLTANGSEYFGRKIGDMYTADLPFCVERIRAWFDSAFNNAKKFASEAREANARSSALPKCVEALEKIKAECRYYTERYEKLGPEQTNRDGTEYESSGYVQEKLADIVVIADAALSAAKGEAE